MRYSAPSARDWAWIIVRQAEIMQHAKAYLDKLARGIDPLTGREVPEDEIINNVRISRRLFKQVTVKCSVGKALLPTDKLN